MELWRVHKADRELRCVARHLPTGIDLRLLEGDTFRRTELFREVPPLNAKANQWLQALRDVGWQNVDG